jgi:hypothetical protein
MTYERITAAPVKECLALAIEVLTTRMPLERVGGDGHSVKLGGRDGTVTIAAHRHGMDTVVHAATDQLRTSRLDMDVQYYMTLLPYQPGDRRERRPVLPGGLSR